jgi:hypothetical protein
MMDTALVVEELPPKKKKNWQPHPHSQVHTCRPLLLLLLSKTNMTY